MSDDCARKLSTAAALSSLTIRDPSIFVEHIGQASSVFKYLQKNTDIKLCRKSFDLL